MSQQGSTKSAAQRRKSASVGKARSGRRRTADNGTTHRRETEATATAERDKTPSNAAATKRGSSQPAKSAAAKRAPRQEGPRTTLRLPKSLAATAEHVGNLQGISRNDAVVKLAEIGAEHQLRLDAIAQRRDKRLVAWRGRERSQSNEFPSADEFEAAVALARAEDAEATK